MPITAAPGRNSAKRSTGPLVPPSGITRVVRPRGEDRRGGGEVRLNAAATAPDREESAESTQHAGANATAPNDEGAKAEPPDARLRRHRNAEGERFVVATVRRTNQDAWTRASEAIQPVAAHTQAEDPADGFE